MPPRRRHARNARAPIVNADAALARAAHQLASGHALEALRSVRIAEDLLRLDSRLQARFAYEERACKAARESQQTLKLQQAELDRRAALLDAREARLAEDRAKLEVLREQVNALYALMYAKGGDDDPAADAAGASSATEPQTVSGVAPL